MHCVVGVVGPMCLRHRLFTNKLIVLKVRLQQKAYFTDSDENEAKVKLEAVYQHRMCVLMTR